MTRSEVRTFIETGINALSQTVGFNSGKMDEFNSQPDKPYPFAWLESIGVRSEFTGQYLPIDEWEISIWIVKKDSLDSAPEQYEAIIDECDSIGQKLQYYYNQTVSGYKLVTLKGMERVPVVKKLADCTTGINLRFVLNAPDQTDNCS